MSVRGEPIEAPGKPDGSPAPLPDVPVAPLESALVAGQVAILERVAMGAPLGGILEDSVRLCEDLHPDMLASILLLDEDGIRLRHGAGPRLPEAYRAAIDGSAIGPAAGSCGTAAFRGEPVLVEDIATDPLWAAYREFALPHGLRSCWSTPIFDADHKVLGTFAIYYRRPCLPTPWHRRVIQVITHLASIAISRQRTEEALRKSEERRLRLLEEKGRAAVERSLELERLVGERTAELERKNKDLETFSYSVSHDLKAPLRGIDGYSKLLAEEYGPALDEEGRRYLANIRQGAGQMHQLIEDMLAYARLDRRVPALGPVDLRAAVSAVSTERRYDLDRIAYTEDVAPGLVIADREGLAMALRNLLDNAYKFSQKRPAPAITVTSRVEGGRHLLTVKDNGTGFSMKHHETIFQIFQRLHRSEEYGGTGVGLALVRKAMDRMGGRVWAESAPDQGASFHLDLLVALPAEAGGKAA